jgi:hypothetical protein
MDAVQTANRGVSSFPIQSDILHRFEESTIRLAPRVEAALSLLLDALDYAQDLCSNLWDFAVEIGCLRDLQLSKSDLRWLTGAGFVDHALEVTLPGEFQRSFRQHIPLRFCKRTCFVLTPLGAELARKVCGRSGVVVAAKTVPASWPAAAVLFEKALPKWDRDRQELTIGTIIVKRFKVPANNQEIVLAAFEEEHWPTRIDDPLPPHREQPPKRRLQETIKSLNRNRKQPLIRFLGDGTGQGVRWEFCGPKDASRQA